MRGQEAIALPERVWSCRTKEFTNILSSFSDLARHEVVEGKSLYLDKSTFVLPAHRSNRRLDDDDGRRQGGEKQSS